MRGKKKGEKVRERAKKSGKRQRMSNTFQGSGVRTKACIMYEYKLDAVL